MPTKKPDEKTENSNGKNYFKTFAITSAIAATLITGIIKGPNYINKLNPNLYNESSKMLSDTTFQKYLKQRAKSAEDFLNSEEKYSSKKLEKYLDAIYGKNPLD